MEDCAENFGEIANFFRIFAPTNIKRKEKTMATYAITLNERTTSGKALMAYLQALGVLVTKVSPKAKGSLARSREDKLAGRVEKFASSEEICRLLGMSPERRLAADLGARRQGIDIAFYRYHWSPLYDDVMQTGIAV